MSTRAPERRLICFVLCGFGVMTLAVDPDAAPAAKESCPDYPTYVELQSDTREVVNLSGRWQFQLDNDNTGEEERFFRPDVLLDSSVAVPGAWQAQGFGKTGTGWYKRKTRLPVVAQPSRIWLKIGAVHPSCDVWINGQRVGSVKQPGIPTRFDVTEIVRPGAENDITIKVYEENRGLGNWYNLYPQWWSGLWRKVELEITRDVWIDDLWIVPDIDKSTAMIRATVASARNEPTDIEVVAEVAPIGYDRIHFSATAQVCVAGHQEKLVEIAVPISNARTWSPRTPNLYEARVRMVEQHKTIDSVKDRFGMRKIKAQGKLLYLNNKPVYLRGYGDDGYYPQTLCPDTNVESIKAHLRMAKEYGFNFAYPCLVMQPEEYLDAADEVGMLVEYDAGAPLAFQRGGPGGLPAKVSTEDKYRLIAEQWSAILKWTQNHPSLVIYSTGSELSADPMLTRLYYLAKGKDPTRLVLSWSDETDVFESGVGLSEPIEPSETIHQRLRSNSVLPHIVHEYAAPESLSSYSAQAAAAAERLGIGDLFPMFITNSRKLASSTRKLMIEEARKAEGFAGYAMWLIQDIPGYPQGIFDYDWRPKDLSAAEFVKSNGPSILMMHEASCRTRRCFRATERAVFEVLASNDDDAPIRGELAWKISDRSTGAAFGTGKTARVTSEPYSSGRLSTIEITMPETPRAVAATLTMAVEGKGPRLRNDWPIWLFPKDLLGSVRSRIGIYDKSEQALKSVRRVFPFVGGFTPNTDLVISNVMDDQLMKYLVGGGKVILITPGNAYPCTIIETRFQSRWPNSAEGANINATIIRDHPLSADFPHDGYCDYQFYNLIGAGGRGIAFRNPDGVRPIVEVFHTESRAAYVFEAGVGKGKLLATTFRLADT